MAYEGEADLDFITLINEGVSPNGHFTYNDLCSVEQSIDVLLRDMAKKQEPFPSNIATDMTVTESVQPSSVFVGQKAGKDPLLSDIATDKMTLAESVQPSSVFVGDNVGKDPFLSDIATDKNAMMNSVQPVSVVLGSVSTAQDVSIANRQDPFLSDIATDKIMVTESVQRVSVVLESYNPNSFTNNLNITSLSSPTAQDDPIPSSTNNFNITSISPLTAEDFILINAEVNFNTDEPCTVTEVIQQTLGDIYKDDPFIPLIQLQGSGLMQHGLQDDVVIQNTTENLCDGQNTQEMMSDCQNIQKVGQNIKKNGHNIQEIKSGGQNIQKGGQNIKKNGQNIQKIKSDDQNIQEIMLNAPASQLKEDVKPKKRGRKPKSETGLTQRELRRQKRKLLYEQPPLEDEVAEKRRKNAVIAKLHRDAAKAKLEEVTEERDQLKKEVEELRRENAWLKLKQQQQWIKNNTSF